MSEKWCPAGKIECENYYQVLPGFYPAYPKRCALDNSICLEIISQCPFPDRQQPVVEPVPPWCEILKDHADCENCSDNGCSKNPSFYSADYWRGYNSALDDAMAAVNKILSWANPQFEQYGHKWDCHKDDAIAAINALKK